MGQTLTNGIYLPSEGERNCYAGLAANWNAVDTLKGSYSAHAINVEIHVTTAEKNLWNTVSDKANDTDVVHKAGDETITGVKTFGSQQSYRGYPSIKLYDLNDDINVLPSATVNREIRFTDKNNAVIAYFVFQHRNDVNEPFRTCWRQNRLDGTDSYYSVNFNNLGEFYPENNNAIKLGTSARRWKDCQTNLINGINPGALFLPQGRSNRVDISAYFTATASGDTNRMTAPDDGFIFLLLTDVLVAHCLSQTANTLLNYGQTFARLDAGILYILFPIRKNDIFSCQWYTTATAVTVNNAFFIPCKGNI